MPIEIVVPRLGWSMDEGTFGEWLINDGELIKLGDMIFVLEGEKAAQEIESFDSGILHIPTDAPGPGDAVAVGQLLGYLLAEGESPPASAKATSAENTRSGAPTSAATGAQHVSDTVMPRKQSRSTASPRARRKASELGLDWRHLVGSGRNGRIRERDILAAGNQSTSVSIQHSPQASLPDVPGRLRSPSKIRRTIARRMLASLEQTAPVTLTTTVNATNLLAVRQRYRDDRMETTPTIDDVLLKLVSSLLPECPELNACWVNDAIYTYDEINIAIAIDTPAGLVAPVLRGANAKNIEEIAAESRRLAELCRSGQLAEGDLAGGTFTITNLGMFDVDHFTPIINLPQTAVLGIGRIADAPIVVDGQVVAGKTLSLNLTFDHRVIDGAPAALWLQRLSKRIQRPETEIV